MRIVIAVLISVHALIHVFGFLKAFKLSSFQGISASVSKPLGLAWLAAFLLLAVTAFLFFNRSAHWWWIGIVSVALSQVLIIAFWQDARFGTLLNLLVLMLAVHGYAAHHFKKMIATEVNEINARESTGANSLVTEESFSTLPAPVRLWLTSSGMVGKETIQNVYMEQEVQMLMKPDQKEWNAGISRQYVTTESPAFHWTVELKMNQFLPVVGRDKFENGKGEMLIKLLSLFPVVNEQGSQKLNQATLQRYLSEIVWYPSAALSPYITWKPMSEHSALATMTYEGTTGSGVFHFHEDGTFKEFSAQRYRDVNDEQPTLWTVKATKTEAIHGIKLPTEAEVEWQLEDGPWKWLKMKVTLVEFNPPAPQM